MRSISTKFILAISLALLSISAFLLHRIYFITKNHTIELISQQAEMALEFDLAIRRYAAEKIRPRVTLYLPPGAFIPELMSTTFITRSVFESVRKKFPDYMLKFTSINPRNPLNLASPAEAERIDFFNKHPEIKDWQGEIVINGRPYFAHLYPDRAAKTCLRCHGNPADAPHDLLDLYGLDASFHYSLNDVLGINTIALPLDTINAHLMKKFNTIIWLGGLGIFLLFVFIYCSFQWLINRRLTTMSRLLKEAESHLDPTNTPLLPVKGKDEISRLAESYNALIIKLKTSYLEQEQQLSERSQINEKLAKEIDERRTAEASLNRMQDELEKLVGERTDKLVMTMVSLEKEILERQITQNALGVERDKLTNLLNTIPDGVCIRNSDQEVEFINPVLEKEFGPGLGKKIDEYFIGIHLPSLAPTHEDLDNMAEQDAIQWEWTSPANGKTYDLVSTPLRNQEGTISILMILRDITSRKLSEQKLKEHERYLRTLMATIQTGVLVSDPETGEILEANPFAAKMIGFSADRLTGRRYQDFLQGGREAATFAHPERLGDTGQDDCLLTTVNNELAHVRRSFASVTSSNKALFIQSLLDISDIKELLRQQAIDISLARSILGLVNGYPPRIIDINDSLALHTCIFAMPCHAEGGDHVFVKPLAKSRTNKHTKTVISIKDQSGHAVNCIMRSIVTDILHHAILTVKSNETIATSISLLNETILDSGLFEPDDFVTAITAELDHETLSLNYVSAGHPAFLLIRGNSVLAIPKASESGANLPLAVMDGISFSSGQVSLEPGDRLIFFTDGLQDIGVRNNHKSLSIEELKDIFAAFLSENPKLPVSELILAVIAALAQDSSETFIPFTTNSSTDDITVVGLELEKQAHDYEVILSPSEETIDLLIESTIQAMCKALTAQGYTLVEQSSLHMVLTEAILNAWKHGNNKDPEKQITVRWRFGNDFNLEVLDEGNGFNFANLKDPTAASNLIRTSGRGLFIIRHFSDYVRWKDNGRRIIITFKKYIFEQEKVHFRRTEALAALMRNIDKT